MSALDKILRSIVLKGSSHLLKAVEKCRTQPLENQAGVFAHIMECSQETAFGKEKGLNKGLAFKEFQKRVPIYNYNSFQPYIDRLRKGEDYVLWNEKVSWFARSSGTSSDKSKFIPVTPESLRKTHFNGMKMMAVNYMSQNPLTKIPTTKALTLGGSIICTHEHLKKGIYSGDLSAVMLQHSPKIVELIRTPSKKVALIAEFDKKVELIAQQSTRQNVSNFSGVPSWNLVMLNRILEYTGKSNLLEIWPNLEVFFHGGTNFLPYKELYHKLIPSSNMHYVENYNASEGYFAFQDEIVTESRTMSSSEPVGMLLCTNNGIFYEFIPFKHLDGAFAGDNSQIVPLEGVEKGVDYAIVITTVGGLYRYMPEDLVRFVSTDPYRIVISGRTKLYINAFGEELMTENAERALAEVCRKTNVEITEFSVAPEFMAYDQSGKFRKGRHIWAIEFKTPELQRGSEKFNDKKLQEFATLLDHELTLVNSDYEAKRSKSTTLQELKIESLKEGTYMRWMESRGKVGGQNKVPRLWRDKTYIEQLLSLQ